jgi:hypothetical protein
MFLIDPIILCKLTDSKEKEMLIKRKIITESIVKNIGKDKRKYISFGIFENETKKLEVIYFFY